MSSYRPIDSKREEFRKYLERTGVMDALTKALVALYEEPDKPEDALGYIRGYLGSGGTSGGGGGGGGGSISTDDVAKSLPKQMEDLKMKTDKSDSTMKGGGDQANVPLASEVKTVVESNPVGAEGDAPTAISQDGTDIVSPGAEITLKRVAESIPPEGVA